MFKMFGKGDRSGRLVRVDVFIIIATFIAISMMTGKNASVKPLEFIPQSTGYQLQRVNIVKSKANFINAGSIEIRDNGTVFSIEGEPLYTCENNEGDELLDTIAINYKKVMKKLDTQKETAAGVIETGGNYFLAAKQSEHTSEKDKYIFYSLSNYIPAPKLDYDQLVMLAKSYKSIG